MSNLPAEVLAYIERVLQESKEELANMTKEEKKQRSARFWAIHDERMKEIREQEEKMRITPDHLNRYYDI